MTEHRADCIIVGGGIGGAVLALALAQKGFKSIILEKSIAPAGTQRPEILASRTVETFSLLGVRDAMMREALLPLEGLELLESGRGRLFHIAQEDFAAVGAQPYSTDPGRTRGILLEAAQAHGAVQVLRGVEMRELLRENGRVAGVRAARGDEMLDFHAPLVIGDDGGHSRVRQALGIRLKLRNFMLQFFCAHAPALPGQPARIGRAYIHPPHVRHGFLGGVFMPLPGNRSAMALLATAKSLEGFKMHGPAMFYEAAAELSPLCWDLHRQLRYPEDFGHFTRPFGHAARYVTDGAALMGDAAHPMTPAGGQGANASVADAMALADAAAAALSAKDCSAKRLAAYEAVRRPANAHSLRFSSRADYAFRLLHLLPVLSPLYLWGLSSIESSYRTKRIFVRSVSQAFAS